MRVRCSPGRPVQLAGAQGAWDKSSRPMHAWPHVPQAASHGLCFLTSKALCFVSCCLQRYPVEASLKHQHRAQQQAAQQPDMRNTAPACSTSSSTYRPGRQLPKHQQRRKARSAPLPIQAVTATLNHATNLSTVQELVHSYGNRLDHVHISTIMRKLVSFKQSDEVLWYTPAAVAAEQLQLLQFEQRRRAQAMRRSRALMSVDGTQWQGPSLSHVSDAADEYTGQEEADDEGPEDSTAADSSGFSRRYSSYAAREADAVSERLASAQGASTSAPGASAARSIGRNAASSRLAAPSSASVGGTPPQTMAQARREAAQQLWALLKRVVQLSCDRRLQFSLHTAATTLEALVRLGYTDQSRVHTLLAATKPLVHELRHQPATAPAVQPPASADAGSGGDNSMVSSGAVLDSTAELSTASAPGSLQLDSSEGQPALVLEALEQSHPDVHQSSDLDVEAGSSLPSSSPLPGPGGSSSEEQQAAYPGGMSKSQWRRQRQRQEDAAANAALNTRSVVSLVWACAELQLSPPSGWLDDVEAATLTRLPSMSLEEVVALVEALGKLRHRVGDAWLMQCEAATAALLPSAQPREAVRLLAGLWRMRHRPDDAWMQTFLMATGPELESLSTQQLTDLLMVLSRMSCKPSDGWMTAYCGAMEQQLLQGQQQQRRPLSSLASLDGGSGGTLAAVAAAAAGGPGGNGGGGSALTAEQLTSLVTALARLGCRPDSAWLNDCLLRSRRCLPAADASQLSRLIHSLAALRFRASEAWLQLYLSAAFSRMPYASPLECCRMVVALAKLGQKPHGLWLQELTARVRGRLSLFTCGQLAEFAGSLVRLGFRPDSAWLLEFERCSSSKLEQGGCEELVGIVWALAEMGHRPEVSRGEGHCVGLIGCRGMLPMCGLQGQLGNVRYTTMFTQRSE